MNHHNPEVTASDRTANRPTPSPRRGRRADRRGRHADQATNRDLARASIRPGARWSPPRAEVDALQRGRERAGEEDRKHETEQAGRLANVVRRGEGFPGESRAVASDAEPGGDGGEDRRADALGHERGDDDHQREERDERLSGQRDAAIDELDLEHALPHPPEQESLQTGPEARRSDRARRCCVCPRWPWRGSCDSLIASMSSVVSSE